MYDYILSKNILRRKIMYTEKIIDPDGYEQSFD